MGGYEAIPFGIQTFFNLHFDWAIMQVDIESTFDNIFGTSIFKKLCDVKNLWWVLSPLPNCFMMFILLFASSMGNMWRGWPLLN